VAKSQTAVTSGERADGVAASECAVDNCVDISDVEHGSERPWCGR
jgi:hypothetical protein